MQSAPMCNSLKTEALPAIGNLSLERSRAPNEAADALSLSEWAINDNNNDNNDDNKTQLTHF